MRAGAGRWLGNANARKREGWGLLWQVGKGYARQSGSGAEGPHDVVGYPHFFLLAREKVGTQFRAVEEKSTYNLATGTLKSFGAQGTK